MDEYLLPFERVKRSVLVRRIAQTSDKFGMNPKDRTVEQLLQVGIVNIDKPEGPTSHQVSAYVQRILGLTKSGHSGTLDPNVTGCLPVTLEKSTKIVQTLLTAGKEYICIMHLHKEVPDYELYKALDKFTGKINQLPPVKSAVKREWRERTVYYIEILSKLEQDILFRVGTQAGTYIRKLVHDIGQELGCGAHMAELRRSKAGPFSESTLCTLQDLADAYHYYKAGNDKYIRRLVMPVEFGISHLPKIWVMDTTIDTICHGASLSVPGISKLETGIQKGDMVAILSLKDELVSFGIATLSSKEMMGEKGLAVKADKVLMEPGTYPKIVLKS
ncbi:MAG: RNA-guided pseudouridylation complex pseudouridine synthase subunit Cbf5 [Nanoarchaeota archaeon]|nr:RNA-guided pseudouridylation complex pseudouridine synthase subunit Cbf5 [Nanoarchaeota archaeon]